jgi:hypothetical protein
LPEDVVSWEANRADNERQQARRQLCGAAWVAVRARGGGGRKLPLSLNPREMAMRRRMKMRKRGR